MNQKNKIKKESGILVADALSCFLLIAFTFLMIYVCACYVRMIQIRLEINEIGRQYLYKIEAKGYLTDDDKNDMIKELTESIYINGKSIVFVDSIDFSGTSTSKIEYGETVNLVCKLEFANPLYTYFLNLKNEGSMFDIDIPSSQRVTHIIDMSATSKW